MDDEATPQAETPDVKSTADAEATPVVAAVPEVTQRPWVSWVAVAFCIGIFLALQFTSDEGDERLTKFGWLPAPEIWSGKYWALFTSAFVHLELWHMGFNVYWIWALGSRMERAVGSPRYLVFYIAAACISSAFELAWSDGTGIGASGVVYAIFGFMWVTRRRYPSFNEVLDGQTIPIFVLWLVGCMVASAIDAADIGNAAHASGLAFGAGIAGAFVLRWKRPLTFAGLTTMAGIAVMALVWCPWSVLWQCCKGYDAHEAGRYDEAVARYSEAIRLDPKNAWGYQGRSIVYQSLEEPAKAEADLQKAIELDPSLKVEK